MLLQGEDGGIDGMSGAPSICRANQPLRCEGNELVHCNADGTAELTESCAFGCSPSETRCASIDPSNGLTRYLDTATTEPDFNLGISAKINTDDGTVIVDNSPISIRSALVAQTSAPTILVFIVHSLIANNVTITGHNAFAVVSADDIHIGGVFAAPAVDLQPVPGRFNNTTCQGRPSAMVPGNALGGAGGGAFGAPGGRGGTASNTDGISAGGAGGSATGNDTLVPLRGGCDSGIIGNLFGSGGGAIQLSSRTKIVINGVITANGTGMLGGGSGGGILIEAPIVELSGSIVANGGAGAGGCVIPQAGETGRFDATPAHAGVACCERCSNGGDGAAGSIGARNGIDMALNEARFVFAGSGGGGVGRIRVNTAPGEFHRAGLISPNPSTGTIAVR